VALGEGHDIVTGETCFPASLNLNLGDIAVLPFLFCGQACANLCLQVKAIKLQLTCLCLILIGFS
jgi:hypothetical protein